MTDPTAIAKSALLKFAEYGVLGLIAACFIFGVGWFVWQVTPPVKAYINSAAEAHTKQTETMLKMTYTLEQMEVQRRNGEEKIVSKISLACVRKRQ